jgi:glycosyltransferase involved in cell wall biosynthesis
VRALFVTTGYPTPSSPAGGIFVREHARAVAPHADVAMLHLDRSPEHTGLPRVVRVDGEPFPTWRVTYPWSPTAASMALHFVAAARGWNAVRRAGFRPDLVHSHFFLAGVPGDLLARALRVPAVVTEHWSVFLPDDPMQLTPSLRRGAAFAFRNADALLPVSEALRKGIEAQGLRARSVRVVPNAVDTDLFTPGGDTRNGRLLAVGLLYEAKAYDVLLRAVATLDVGLDIVGDGPLRGELEALAGSLGVADRVTFHGLLPKPEVARLMREAELFVLASHYENNPCSLIEALASGLPVVATSVGGVPELVDAANGVLVQPGDPESLAVQIRAALGAAYDRAAIAADARHRYGAATVGGILADVYSSVIRRRRA